MGKFMPIPSCQFLNLDGRQLETDCRMAKHPEIALISKFVLFLPPEILAYSIYNTKQKQCGGIASYPLSLILRQISNSLTPQ